MSLQTAGQLSTLAAVAPVVKDRRSLPSAR
jgi:hypothetical protein